MNRTESLHVKKATEKTPWRSSGTRARGHATRPTGAHATLIFLCGLAVAGWPESAANASPLVHKQQRHDIAQEQVTRYISPSGDRYDSFRRMIVTQRSGIQVNIPIDSNGNGYFVTQHGMRVLPVEFSCDYSKGLTRGEVEITYQDPKNLYGQISGSLTVECVPMTDDERAQQMAAQAEVARRNDEAREAEERRCKVAADRDEARRAEQAEALRLRQEKEAREAAYRESPAGKRDWARSHILRMREEIRLAKERISDERRVGAISGYVDKRRLHELGSLIVAAEREIDRAWKIYRENGGTATSAANIR